jgi:WD40 repeat protein
MRYLFFVFSFIILSFQLSAQQNFSELRKKYEDFSNHKSLDSALIYAFKTKTAALKEFGLGSVNYLRSTNSIGYCYLSLASSPDDKFIDSARFWLTETYKQVLPHKESAYQAPRMGVLINLSQLYTIKLKRIDSALFYTDQFIALQFQQKQSPEDLINTILERATEIESFLGLDIADKYYKKALDVRTAYFGSFNTKIITGLDSILRKDPITNTPNRRLSIYDALADPFSLKELRKIVEEPNQVNGLQDYFENLTSLNDETLRLEGQKSLHVIENLWKLGKYYLDWFGDREFASYYFQNAVTLLQQSDKKNLKIAALLEADLKSLKETSMITLSASKDVIFDTSPTNHADNPQTNNPSLRLMLPIGHPQGITNAAISENGKLVYSKSFNDVNVKIWDVATGALIYNLPMAATPNFGLFAQDQYIFVSCGRQCILWNLKDGTKKWEKFLSSDVRVGLLANNGNNLIIGDQANNVLVLETVTGKIVNNLKLDNEIINFYPRNNNSLLMHIREKDKTNSLFIFDYIKGSAVPFLQKQPFDVAVSRSTFSVFYPTQAANFDLNSLKLKSSFVIDSGSNRQILSPNGNKLFLSYGSDSTRVIYETNTGDCLSNYTYGYPAQNFSFIGDGKTYLSHDGIDAGIWKSETGEFVGTLNCDSTARLRRNVDGFFKFSADDKYMLVAFSDNVLRLWDVSGNKPTLVRSFAGKTSALYVTAFSDDKNYLATKDNEDYIKIIDLKSGKILGTVEHPTLAEAGIIFDHQNKQLITNSDSSIKVWDFPSLQLRKEIKYPGVRSMDISKDNNSLMTSSFDKSEVRIWNLTNFSYDSLKIDSVSGAKYNRLNDQLLISKKELGFMLFDAKTKKVLSTTRVPEWDYLTEFANQDQFIIHLTGSNVWLFDAASGKLINKFKIDNEVNTVGVSISPDGKMLLIGEHSGKLSVYDIHTKEKLKEIVAHTAGFKPILLENSKKLLTCSDDGTIKVWNFENLQLSYQLVPFGDSDYVIYTPSGYYTASPQASKYLHYVTKDLNVIGFDQLDVRYNRPDKVFAQIGGIDKSLISLYEKAYYKRIKKLGVDTSSFKEGFAVPEADFEGRDKIGLEQKEQQLTLRIKGNDPKQALRHFNVWINDIPLFGVKGKSISGNNKGIDTTITVSLSQGKNTIETSVSNIAGIESFRKPLIIFYNPLEKIKEKVWFIGIGIGDFKDKEHNLEWSATDIINLNRELKLKYKDNYHAALLLNKDVTTQNIKAIKKMLLDSTNINDKVILSFSGHGLMSENFDYYLSSYDTDFKHPEKNGLPYDLIEGLMDSIPARKKLMLIDACYSGEIDKDEIRKNGSTEKSSGQKGTVVYNYSKNSSVAKNPFELMQLLFNNVSRNTGAVVISASAGNQSALEKNELKSGVFTYSVLEMIKSDQKFKISDFKKQVIKRVSELSKGVQIPTIRGDSKNYDWELW